MNTHKRNAVTQLRQDVTAPPAAVLLITSVDAAILNLALSRVEDDIERGLLAFVDDPRPAVSYELLFDVAALRQRLARAVTSAADRKGA